MVNEYGEPLSTRAPVRTLPPKKAKKPERKPWRFWYVCTRCKHSAWCKAKRFDTHQRPTQCRECGHSGFLEKTQGKTKAQRQASFMSWHQHRRRKDGVAPKRRKGRKQDYGAYLGSAQWRELRRLVIARDKGQCRECGSTERLHVHHVHYQTIFEETGRELVTLCARCHSLEHKNSLKDSRERWRGLLGRVRQGSPASGSVSSTEDVGVCPIGAAVE